MNICRVFLWLPGRYLIRTLYLTASYCKLQHEWTLSCVMIMRIIASNEKRKMMLAAAASTTYSSLIVHLMLLFLFMFVQKLYFNSIMFNVHLNIKWILRPTISHLLFLRINAGARFINIEERLPIIDCYYFGNRSIHFCCCCCFFHSSSAYFCRTDRNWWKWIYSYAITANHIDQFRSMLLVDSIFLCKELLRDSISLHHQRTRAGMVMFQCFLLFLVIIFCSSSSINLWRRIYFPMAMG